MWNNLYRPNVAIRQLLLKLTTKRHRNQLLEQSMKYLSSNASAIAKQTEETVPNDKVARKLMSELRVVLKEATGSDFTKNEKVAQTLATVKKKNLPVFFIEKALQEKKLEQSTHLLEGIAPHNLLVLIHIEGVNKMLAGNPIRTPLRKIGIKLVSDSRVLSEFNPVYTIICQKNCTLDDAVADGIEVNADNVEEIEWNNQKFFEFTINVLYGLNAHKYLLNADYDIFFSDVVHEPKEPIEPDEQASTLLRTLDDILKSIPTVRRVEYNLQ